MALVIPGKTACGLCGRTLERTDDVVGFPAFLPSSHALSNFSDGAFHRTCLDAAPEHAAVQGLYGRYQAIWASRPASLKTSRDMEEWGKRAFADFPGDEEGS